MTFDTIDNRNLFIKNLRTSTCQRCCYSKKKNKFDLRVFENRILIANTPAQPVNIKWTNMAYTGKSKMTRRLISWLMTIVLFLVCKPILPNPP